jgi:hypothetical protein
MHPLKEEIHFIRIRLCGLSDFGNWSNLFKLLILNSCNNILSFQDYMTSNDDAVNEKRIERSMEETVCDLFYDNVLASEPCLVTE